MKSYHVIYLKFLLLSVTTFATFNHLQAQNTKDNNPANPVNWEKVSSVSGLVSYLTYGPFQTNPTSGSWNLSSPPNPALVGIQGWIDHKGTWNLTGTSNFRWKWVGLGPAPNDVRVYNFCSSGALFSGTYSFTNIISGVPNIQEIFNSENPSKRGSGPVTVDSDTLFSIGYSQQAEVSDPIFGNASSSGTFNWAATSDLAELSTALRYSVTTYHKEGSFDQQVANIGSSYSDWVMDTCVPSEIFSTTFVLSNGLSGPWNTSSCIFHYTSDDVLSGSLYSDTLTSKTVQYEFTKQQWVALADAPQERTVSVVISDPSALDNPSRTAKIKIRLHNPYEGWRLNRHPDGSPYESLYWKDPEFKEFSPVSKTSTFMGDENGLTFKYRHSYPIIQHIQDGITGSPLLKALQDFVPIKWVPIAIKAVITVPTVLSAEEWQGPVTATFEEKWNSSDSTFSPSKDESKKNQYMMTASVKLKYKQNSWICDEYNNTGYVGHQDGSTDMRVPGQYVYGIFNIQAGGGGDEGGGITPYGG